MISPSDLDVLEHDAWGCHTRELSYVRGERLIALRGGGQAQSMALGMRRCNPWTV